MQARTEQLEPAPLSAQDPCCDGTTVNTHPHRQVGRVRPKNDFKLWQDQLKLVHAVHRETCHGDGMVFSWIGEPDDCHITITLFVDVVRKKDDKAGNCDATDDDDQKYEQKSLRTTVSTLKIRRRFAIESNSLKILSRS
jgi:hypothetical protein